MKMSKRWLSAMLAILISLGLFLPAAADESKTSDLYTPIITKQPVANIKTATNRTITLFVEAELPEGSDGVLLYQWYRVEDGVAVPMAGETSPELKLRLTYEDLDKDTFEELSLELVDTDNILEFYVDIICDRAENGIYTKTTSDSSIVSLYANLPDYFRSIQNGFSKLMKAEPENIEAAFFKWFCLFILIPLVVIDLPTHFFNYWFR